ncbi:MAG: porphobilinogen synthase [Verrucomicrobia bacterium]|nr:porphobilinogen synthase [Verrucomicrobiota bacterium]
MTLANFTTTQFPIIRPRRLRRHAWLRDMVQEHYVGPKDLVWTVIIREDHVDPTIPGMPGSPRLSIRELVERAQEAEDLGIPAIAFFPHVEQHLKDESASEALNPGSLTIRAIEALKKHCPNLGVISDVALDPFTSHGFDGLMKGDQVDNDSTLELLAKSVLLHVQAGADVIAPSEMMDGRIKVLRETLDGAGYQDVSLLSYSAKYASAFYGPYRGGIGSLGNLGKGDKKTFYVNPANKAEALREVSQDLLEGADMVMVKPGLPYLDVISAIKETFHVPTFAFHVSGEYGCLKLMHEAGFMDFARAFHEVLISFKRAGCDGILTYGALEYARLL